MAHLDKGWWRTADGRVILPYKLGQTILGKIHQASHLGTKKMRSLLKQSDLRIPDGNYLIKEIVSKCGACQLTNACLAPNSSGTKIRETQPGTYWKVDFTEIKSEEFGYKYLLVFKDTFSGWTKAFPTKHKTANMVAKKLVEEIVPRWISHHDQGRQRPGFCLAGKPGNSHCTGLFQCKLEITLCIPAPKLRTGKKINKTLKETLTKLALETGMD